MAVWETILTYLVIIVVGIILGIFLGFLLRNIIIYIRKLIFKKTIVKKLLNQQTKIINVNDKNYALVPSKEFKKELEDTTLKSELATANKKKGRGIKPVRKGVASVNVADTPPSIYKDTLGLNEIKEEINKNETKGSEKED